MKFVSTLFIVIALVLIVFNATKVNFNTPFEGDSIVALITILAALCAIVLMLILKISKRIEEKVKHKK
ncbi:hypothetical protein [Aestuariivivens sp. NBU2969]|uniref:hypothetical protein n=1 Tax=Aestuariivivens sp. NBU2969 TaxID=2873267 RepID=UPI001CBAF85C|nr:hypothetical protein [Aestuariivivens sp. NBU2969]